MIKCTKYQFIIYRQLKRLSEHSEYIAMII